MKLRIVGSIIVLLSALFPLADNIISYTVGNDFGMDIAQRYGHTNFNNFLYTVGAASTPILLAIASRFRAYLVSYAVVVFTYSADFFWIFSKHESSFDFSYLYALLFSIGFFISAILLKRIIERDTNRYNLIETLLNKKIKINKGDE